MSPPLKVFFSNKKFNNYLHSRILRLGSLCEEESQNAQGNQLKIPRGRGKATIARDPVREVWQSQTERDLDSKEREGRWTCLLGEQGETLRKFSLSEIRNAALKGVGVETEHQRITQNN